MHVWIIARREMKLGFRNPWSYSFLALFSLFSIALMFIGSQNEMGGYTHITGTMMNLILYLLPLMTLLLGAFSLTSEKEEGGWRLLSTYSLSTRSYLLGKYFGLTVVLFVIVLFGYGVSGLIGTALGSSFPLSSMVFFLSFSIGLVLLFLGIAMWIGAVSGNRWQALTFGVGIWFFYILGWPTLLVAALGLLPYIWIKPVLEALVIMNPAEFVRIFMVVRIGGGSIFGPEYYQWIDWIKSPAGVPLFLGLCLAWIAAALGMAAWLWERRRRT